MFACSCKNGILFKYLCKQHTNFPEFHHAGYLETICCPKNMQGPTFSFFAPVLSLPPPDNLLQATGFCGRLPIAIMNADGVAAFYSVSWVTSAAAVVAMAAFLFPARRPGEQPLLASGLQGSCPRIFADRLTGSQLLGSGSCLGPAEPPSLTAQMSEGKGRREQA